VRAHVLPQEIRGYQMMLAKEPERVSLHDDLALLFAETGDFAAALEHFNASLRLQPGVAAAHYNAGLVLLRLGRRDEAALRLREAIALDRVHPGANHELGMLLLQQGQALLAVDHLRRAAIAQPGWTDAQLDLAWALAAAGDRAFASEAVTLASRVEAQTGPTARVLEVLAAAYAANGEVERAVRAAEQAIALAEHDGNSRGVEELRRRLDAYRRDETSQPRR
jgi:tetratricopeptide (TPR) repeat protein